MGLRSLHFIVGWFAVRTLKSNSKWYSQPLKIIV